MSNLKLRERPRFASGPLLLTFAKVPTEKGRMLEPDREGRSLGGMNEEASPVHDACGGSGAGLVADKAVSESRTCRPLRADRPNREP